MKAIKIGLGLLLICGALYVVLGEQLSGASANAFINARLTTSRAPIAGKIDLISRPLGAQVSQGDPLGAIEDPLVDSIRLLDLELEQADVQAEIARLQSVIASFDESIKLLQTRAAIYSEERKRQLEAQAQSAESTRAAAEARLRYAELSRERSSRLSGQGISTAQSLEQAQSLAEVSNLEVASAKAQAAEILVARKAADRGVFLGDGFNDAPYSEQRISEIDVQRLELKAQLESKKLALTAVSERIANERLRVNRLSASNLVANVNGALWEYLSASGETVQRGQDLLRLIDCDSAIVTLSVSESVYNTLRVGAPATFRLSRSRVVLEGSVIRLAGSGAATIYENMAIAPSQRHLQRYDVALDVPALRSDPDLRCLAGRTGRVFFENRAFDWLRGWWG
ncbi:multidrug resistance efflux pump [Agrobacterium larrymoorei]|uniref:Multidrug resistance efflux pump n=1 Tax=Agrobacterium larrymoorei TaxID=160699 RepID=A0AAJ2ET41_9HYPH|nr:HlyD family efflux transporter periplasmic adaptor subunit [Agrobacterium larrymoorei]MDR6099912.1 multidrug resistance efflux pump [Agrobacterium larrymoorei]